MLSPKLFYNKSKAPKIVKRMASNSTVPEKASRGSRGGRGQGRGWGGSTSGLNNSVLPPKKRSNPLIDPFVGKPAAFKAPRKSERKQREDEEEEKRKKAEEARKREEKAIEEMEKERVDRQKHRLIELVWSREMLYNKAHPDYCDSIKMKLAWNAVTTELNERSSKFIDS